MEVFVMKWSSRTFTIICAIAICLVCFSSCGNNYTSSDTISLTSIIDDLPSTLAPETIRSNAENGIIPEIDFKLGDKIGDFKSKYPFYEDLDEPESEASNTENEIIATITANWNQKDITQISIAKPAYEGLEGHADAEEANVVSNYFLITERSASGFSYIGTYGPAYDFLPNGSFVSDVKSKLGEPASESKPTKDSAPLLMVIPDDCVCLSYTMGANKLCFYFTDDQLFATSLENTALWKQ